MTDVIVRGWEMPYTCTGSFSRGGGGGIGIAHNAKTASKTFSGIAKAMAEQWG